ncbi:hypothetical protein DFJ74DRAFT_708901 [Hyaloraphidium curvatum]|nr:hypothetical protein DFJ74DRAFT_708901 [Hyaloraphidium curvatum]
MKDDTTTLADFRGAVNMTTPELEQWLATPESLRVGDHHGDPGGPAEGREGSKWWFSLMNWGHDPEKDRSDEGREGADQ